MVVFLEAIPGSTTRTGRRGDVVTGFDDERPEPEQVGLRFNDVDPGSRVDLHVRRGEHEEGLAIAGFMHEAAEVTGRARDANLSWSLHAALLDELERWDEAIDAYRRTIETADRPDDAAVGHNNLATVYISLKRWEEARAEFRKAIELREGLGSDQGRARTAVSYRGLGDVDAAQDRWAQAAEHFRMAAERAGELSGADGIEREVGAKLELATMESKLGRYEEAIATRRAVLDVAESLGWTSTVAYGWREVGSSLWDLDRYDEALAAFAKALELDRSLENDLRAGHSMTDIGSLYWLKGDLEQASDHYARAESWYREGGHRADALDVQRRSASLERERGRLTQAEQLIRGALQELDEAGLTNTDRLPFVLELARVLQAAERVDEASDSFAAAAELAERPSERAETLDEWGWMLVHAQRTENARQHFEEALRIRRELGDRAGVAESLWHMADLRAGVEGKIDEAVALGEESLAIARDLPSPKLEAEARVALASAHSSAGRLAQASAHLEEALRILADIGLAQTQVRALLAQGALHQSWGELRLAEAAMRNALELAAESELEGWRAAALQNLAWLAQIQGDLEGSQELATEAMELQGSLGQDCGMVSSLITLSTVAGKRGDLAQDLDRQRQALELSRRCEDPWGEAAALNNIGRTHMHQAEWQRALGSLDQALELGTELGHWEVLTASVGNRARCLMELGFPDQALAAVSEGLDAAERFDARVRTIEMMGMKGRLLRELGRFDEAISILGEAEGRAVAAQLELHAANSAAQLGRAQVESGQLEEGLARLEAAVEILGRAGDRGTVWEHWYALGEARRQQGDDEGAIAALEESVAIVEALKGKLGGGTETREAFESDRAEVYESLIDLYSRLGRTDDAWRTVGRMKGNELDEFTGDAATNDEQRAALDEGKAIEGRERAVLARFTAELAKPKSQQDSRVLSELQGQLDALTLRFEEYTEKLAQQFPDLSRRLAIEPPSFYRVQSGLNSNEAFIEPVILPDRLVLFVVRGGNLPLLVREVAVAEQRVHSLIARMRQQLESPRRDWHPPAPSPQPGVALDEPHASAPARELHQLLIEPIAGDLDGVDTLILSPSGKLRYIPFAALFDGEQFLVEHFRMAVLTLAGAIGEARKLDRKARLLAFGDPDGSLPGAEAEVRALRKVWRKRRVRAYLGQDATWIRLRRELEGHGIVHLATHGYLKHERPNDSYLLLAGAGSAARLSFRQIPLLNLAGVDLAVLSACNTALGDKAEGAEIAGLAYQFEKRGAAAVLASLWKVSDASTAELMTYLYKSLSKRQSRADALRDAQLQLLRSSDWSHPYHWAPFLLIGDWR
jgi:pentatricopeptide repeat protein